MIRCHMILNQLRTMQTVTHGATSPDSLIQLGRLRRQNIRQERRPFYTPHPLLVVCKPINDSTPCSLQDLIPMCHLQIPLIPIVILRPRPCRSGGDTHDKHIRDARHFSQGLVDLRVTEMLHYAVVEGDGVARAWELCSADVYSLETDVGGGGGGQ